MALGSTHLAWRSLTALFAAAPAVAVCAGPATAAMTGRIAFVSNRDGDSEIYPMNATGADVVRLTQHDRRRSPAWSPDGTRIAFDSNCTGQYEIWIMNADGSRQTQITADEEGATDPKAGGAETDPSWSPDGGRIAFRSPATTPTASSR
jgi:Tol biopolymer transport system component